MKRNFLSYLVTVMAMVLVLSGCTKDIEVTNPPPKKMDDLNIPPGFNWKTAVDIPVTVTVNFTGGIPQQYVKVSIYKGNPESGGVVMSEGAAGHQFPYSSILSIPTTLTEVYVRVTTPTGQPVVQSVAVTPSIVVTINNVASAAVQADQDADKVPDVLDAYPSDSARAFNSYFPNRAGFGSIMFEDNWPSKGDYDFNDLVVDYQTNLVTDARNYVRRIETKYYIRAAGAALHNGFGFQLDNVSANLVASATGHSLLNGYISLSPNGTEQNQPRAVIVAIDDVNNVIHKVPFAGDFFNTWPDIPKGYSDTLFIMMGFTMPIPIINIGTPPFNPFLIKDKDRGYEIHLPGYIPTNLVNTSLFGQQDDNSEPAKGIYYKSYIYLPWGLFTPEQFDYPFETAPILNAHLFFDSWAQSDGVKYKDWSWDLPEYRDPSKIYH